MQRRSEAQRWIAAHVERVGDLGVTDNRGVGGSHEREGMGVGGVNEKGVIGGLGHKHREGIIRSWGVRGSIGWRAKEPMDHGGRGRCQENLRSTINKVVGGGGAWRGRQHGGARHPVSPNTKG